MFCTPRRQGRWPRGRESALRRSATLGKVDGGDRTVSRPDVASLPIAFAAFIVVNHQHSVGTARQPERTAAIGQAEGTQLPSVLIRPI